MLHGQKQGCIIYVNARDILCTILFSNLLFLFLNFCMNFPTHLLAIFARSQCTTLCRFFQCSNVAGEAIWFEGQLSWIMIHLLSERKKPWSGGPYCQLSLADAPITGWLIIIIIKKNYYIYHAHTDALMNMVVIINMHVEWWYGKEWRTCVKINVWIAKCFFSSVSKFTINPL